MRPQVIVDYNNGKQGVDLSDQSSTYYTCQRRSRKRGQEVVIVNAYLIRKERYDTRCMTMLQFRESLERSLLLGEPFKNLEPGL